MSKENKIIANPGLRLVAALFATIGTLLIAFIKILLLDFLSKKEDSEEDVTYITTNDNTMIGYGSDTPEIIENVTDKS